MASFMTMADANGGEVFESKLSHESSTGTGVFGGGSGYALSIGTASNHAISFHTSGKSSRFVGTKSPEISKTSRFGFRDRQNIKRT